MVRQTMLHPYHGILLCMYQYKLLIRAKSLNESQRQSQPHFLYVKEETIEMENGLVVARVLESEEEGSGCDYKGEAQGRFLQ